MFKFSKKKSSIEDQYKKELEALGLSTLNDLEELLRPLVKEATQVIAKKSTSIPKDSNLKSQFGGNPFFEKGEKWPKAKNGNELEFVFQVFNSKDICLHDDIALVQFFYDYRTEQEGNMPFETDDDGWHVKIYKTVNKDSITIIDKPKNHDNVKYCDIEFKKIKSLPYWESVDAYNENISKLSTVLNPKEPWESFESARVGIIGRTQDTDEECYLTQFGGYPTWMQGEEEFEGKDCEFLFQIYSEDNANLMWGDAGLVYIFLDKKTKKLEFVLQCG